MTTLNQITARLKQIASNHRQVRTVREDDPVNFLQNENKDVAYPACWFTFNGSQLQEKEISYNYVVTLATRVNNEDYNEMEAMSDMELIARDLIGQIDWDKQPWDFNRNVTFEFFREDYEDNLAGVVFQVNLAVPFDFDVCDLPSNYNLPDAGFVYISPDRFRTIADFIVSSTSPIPTNGNSYQSNLFTEPPFVFINGQLINYVADSSRRYLSFSGTTVTIENGGVNEGEHVFIITDSILQINTNRFMTIYDFIVDTGEPMEDGDTTLTDNQFVVPPFVFIDGQLLGYTNTNDRRYVSHNATTKTITINNGGVLSGESVRICL